MKQKPDLLIILMAVFGLGVMFTLFGPMAVNETVAAPASELHAGVFINQ